jgi:hypothetical protein
MSRYIEPQEDGTTVAYGFDIAEGYFFQLFSADDKEDELLISESSLLTGMSNGKMIELLEKYNCNKEHCTLVALDLMI